MMPHEWKARAEAAEAELASVREERDALAAIPKVYLHTTSTGEGMPTGTWREGEPEPTPTVAALGDPDSVRGLLVAVERGKAAEARVAQLETAAKELDGAWSEYSQALGDPNKSRIAMNAKWQGVVSARALLASQPLPSEPEE